MQHLGLDTAVEAETPEGIALALRPAGMQARALAYVVDLMVRFAIFLALAATVGQIPGVGGALLLISWFLLEWFYPVLFELLPGSATPGKRSVGLSVVMDDGLPVTPSASVLRNLLRAADFMPLLYGFGLVTMLLRRDFKRLGDLAAGTLVVHSRAPSRNHALPEVEAQAPAMALTQAQQVAILAWAGRTERLTSERCDELAALAAPAVGMPELKPHQRSRRLLGVAQWLLGHR